MHIDSIRHIVIKMNTSYVHLVTILRNYPVQHLIATCAARTSLRPKQNCRSLHLMSWVRPVGYGDSWGNSKQMRKRTEQIPFKYIQAKQLQSNFIEYINLYRCFGGCVCDWVNPMPTRTSVIHWSITPGLAGFHADGPILKHISVVGWVLG